ncbi:L-aspartate oxidase [Phaeovulum vinaykumarii]|uniref:L-aspartate oxidase n=1 Tax=Phaeovulum vinaykumarii TaxID=407234 RepID=A0A1N7M998_9RHOB|nr:L-aspartate oxidase [Phaeovulum vinaykumarii]SIS82549.1 L-aspartate oxidase [Phaeovulum vinaykumarii]SOC10893.1 L-aspartate oxidase [Phaeovulum vinaykumarii]
MTAERNTDRVVIVGAGLAALSAALDLAPRPVLVISPESLGEGASSVWAQGGVAAAVGATDSPADHAADTMRAGAGTVDAAIARLVTAAAPEHIAVLAELGVPFDRDAAGGFVMSREAAHGRPRVVRVKGDQAGAEIMHALIRAVRAAPSVQVAEGVMATDLVVDQGRVAGVRLVRSGAPSGAVSVRAAAVLLAAGGSGGLFAVTTNPPRVRGQAVGMAARAGAQVADAEFVQFHPTAIDVGQDPAPLATEALRGEGAVLLNSEGTRFMTAVHPDAELAPRDIVARAIFAEHRAGRRPVLDTRAVLGAALLERFPAVAAACREAGIDPVTQPIPVVPAAHYHMGGVATSDRGRASLPGLWVVGEAASTGLHGANRLASNGLLEALVFARRASDDIAADLGPAPASAVPPVDLTFPATGGVTPDPVLITRLRRVMSAEVGVLRNGPGLRRALAEIADIETAAGDCPQLTNMTAAATLIAAAALARRESRGGHARTDHPDPDPAQARRSLLTLTEALEIRARACEEMPA